MKLSLPLGNYCLWWSFLSLISFSNFLKHIFVYCHYLFGAYYHKDTLKAETITYTFPLHPFISQFSVRPMVGAQAMFLMRKHNTFCGSASISLVSEHLYSTTCSAPICTVNPLSFIFVPIFIYKFGLIGTESLFSPANQQAEVCI